MGYMLATHEVEVIEEVCDVSSTDELSYKARKMHGSRSAVVWKLGGAKRPYGTVWERVLVRSGVPYVALEGKGCDSYLEMRDHRRMVQVRGPKSEEPAEEQLRELPLRETWERGVQKIVEEQIWEELAGGSRCTTFRALQEVCGAFWFEPGGS